jgi:hypothetical protein
MGLSLELHEAIQDAEDFDNDHLAWKFGGEEAAGEALNSKVGMYSL